MTEESVQKMLKVIDEIPQSRLQGMDVAANVAFATGKKNGLVVSGNYKAYWSAEKDKAQLHTIIRKSETLKEYA